MTDADLRFYLGELRDLGWPLGSIAFDLRGVAQSLDQLPDLAQELVRVGVDLIVAGNTSAAVAAKQATSTIPILALDVGDPVKYGLALTLAHPGTNVTGLTVPFVDPGKWIELARELVPRLRRVAAIVDPIGVAYSTYATAFETTAQRLGLELQLVPVSRDSQLTSAFEAMKRAQAEVLIFAPSAPDHRGIGALARTYRLPTVGPNSSAIDAGAVLAYGPNLRVMYHRAAAYVDKLLKGARPADLPFEQPTIVELSINLRLAKELGLSISPALKIRADKLIE